jgi:hypothetical protein
MQSVLAIQETTCSPGTLRDVYRPIFGAWFATHPEDPNAEALIEAFIQSDPFQRWQVVPLRGPRTTQIEAFFRFLRTRDDMSVGVARQCFLQEMAKRLHQTPHPAFKVPHEFAGGPSCWVALDRQGTTVHLYAVFDGGIHDERVPLGVATQWLRRAHDRGRLVG